MTARRVSRCTAAAVAVAAALSAFALLPHVSAAKTKADPRTYDVRKKAFGKTFAQWAEEWWEWHHSIPASVSPILDETGEFVEVGQRGPVWFLAGVFNLSGVAERTATIPTGKALFFPIVNNTWDNEGVVPPLSADELVALVARDANSIEVASLQVVLDDSEIQGVAKNRVAAGPFRVHMPEDNIGHFLSGGAAYPRGIYAPFVTDGYWVMLKALVPGDHTLRFKGRNGSFALDITYHLTVVERNRP